MGARSDALSDGSSGAPGGEGTLVMVVLAGGRANHTRKPGSQAGIQHDDIQTMRLFG